jgi:hypothetical protein
MRTKVTNTGACIDAYNRCRAATGAATGFLRITLAQYSNLKSLFFTASGTTFMLTPNVQILPRALNELIGGTSHHIYLIINDIGALTGQGFDFINGYTFLERFYRSSTLPSTASVTPLGHSPQQRAINGKRGHAGMLYLSLANERTRRASRCCTKRSCTTMWRCNPKS